MFTSISINIIVILLFLSIFVFSGSLYIRGNNFTICLDRDNGCNFTVTNYYPISPLIPTSFPNEAIIGEYKYIYLIFNIPNSQVQKTFYLEAYDTSTGETIITNGDCYLINTTENKYYEINIFKDLKKNSYIRFGFFGLPKNFSMTVEIEFKLNIFLYIINIKLSSDNSLNKSEQEPLLNFLKEYYEKKEEQKKKKNRSFKQLKYYLKICLNIL